jgi:hypothetical protein
MKILRALSVFTIPAWQNNSFKLYYGSLLKFS